MMEFTVSIIICTRNRASDLHQTLDSVARVRVPPAIEAELLLVDNGSTDDTRQVAQAFEAPRLPLRYLFERRPGKARALNTALRQARGDVLLFTDDDVRVPSDWIAPMSAPILSGEADAVAGGVVIAPHLRRPWLEHEDFLASTAGINPDRPYRMVGANMAFSRKVREKVPWFDPELGPGALGLEEETLFSLQLREAGYTIAAALDTSVEHHFDPARLTRAGYRSLLRRLGRSQAYVGYHWHHLPSTRLRTCAALGLRGLALTGKRLMHPARRWSYEGLPAWECEGLRWFCYKRQFLEELRRPHNYHTRHGLVKQRGRLPRPAPASASPVLHR